MPAEKAPGERRVVAVGDSFTFGSLVDDAETYPHQLQERLGGRTRIVNLGVPGYQVRQLVRTLELRVPALRPDVVLLTFYVNGTMATPPTYAGRAHEPDPPPPNDAARWVRRLGLTAHAWPNEDASAAQRRMLWWRERSALVDLLANRAFVALFEESSMQDHRHRWRAEGAGWKRILFALDHGVELAEEHGFELQVAMYPMLKDLDAYPLADAHGRLAEACTERGLTFHDLLPPLAGHAPADLWASQQDHHPNALCHRLVAETLAAGIAPALAGR